jgi:hypothetical protein
VTSPSDTATTSAPAEEADRRRVEAVIASEDQLPAVNALIAALQPVLGDATEPAG